MGAIFKVLTLILTTIIKLIKTHNLPLIILKTKYYNKNTTFKFANLLIIYTSNMYIE